jgi:CheY-like chemotaxis protein
MNVLVVDDDDGILQLIGRILGASGNRLLLTTDAREAIAAIEAHDIDLLISDVLMPVMTGPELAAVARRLRPRISVLYMSASERPDGFPVLVKPFQVQELLDAMHCALQGPTATAASEPPAG